MEENAFAAFDDLLQARRGLQISLSLSDLLHTQHVQQQLGQEADGSRHAVVQAVSFLSHILVMAPPVSRPAPSNHTGASRITG